nr:hypothetical protein [Mycoplasmopsis bovis]
MKWWSRYKLNQTKNQGTTLNHKQGTNLNQTRYKLKQNKVQTKAPQQGTDTKAKQYRIKKTRYRAPKAKQYRTK